VVPARVAYRIVGPFIAAAIAWDSGKLLQHLEFPPNFENSQTNGKKTDRAEM